MSSVYNWWISSKYYFISFFKFIDESLKNYSRIPFVNSYNLKLRSAAIVAGWINLKGKG